ncbi:hypothetical protein FD724_07555 [Nostoc sp. C057]|uniref:hypothetical protein n=1 Tax=Nostoc sp. C057 TaxID=2576903 RepID=UPI0015C361B4|nr:hypothetical protein [Nostoc sp. C057]QLE47991.1 hypothetical protein FD724_07555 [Nostoc sp. C057]
MSKTFQVGAGNKVKLYVALLPLGDRTEPEDVSITAASGITSAATSVTVTALTGAIAGGTPLTFDNGTDTLTVYLTADALIGATTIAIEPATAALTGSSTAEYVAKLRLLGGTQLSAKLNSDRADVLVLKMFLATKTVQSLDNPGNCLGLRIYFPVMKLSVEFFLLQATLFPGARFMFGSKIHHPQVMPWAMA